MAKKNAFTLNRRLSKNRQLFWIAQDDLWCAAVRGYLALDLDVFADEPFERADFAFDTLTCRTPHDDVESPLKGRAHVHDRELLLLADRFDFAKDDPFGADLPARLKLVEEFGMWTFWQVSDRAVFDTDLIEVTIFCEHIDHITIREALQHTAAFVGLFVDTGASFHQYHLVDTRADPVVHKQVGVVRGDFGVFDDDPDLSVALKAVLRPVDRADEDLLAVDDDAFCVDLADTYGAEVDELRL